MNEPKGTAQPADAVQRATAGQPGAAMNGTAPNVRNQAPVGSRWMFNAETKGRVFVVTDRKPGGIVEYKQEGRAYFGRSYLRQFLANAHFVGEQQPPNGEVSR